MKRVCVIGGGGHGKVAIATLRAAGFEVSAVFDDDRNLVGTTILGVPVIGTISDYHDHPFAPACLAVGENHLRAAIALRLCDAEWCGVVHPAAVVHETVRLGPGSVVFAGGIVQPDTVIGCHVIVNTRAGVDHDCIIGDFAHVAPGASLAGAVSVGAGAMIGIGASVLPRIRVGAWAVIGGGSVVVNDVAQGTVVKGVPAHGNEPG